jgi:hypothetical protein
MSGALGIMLGSGTADFPELVAVSAVATGTNTLSISKPSGVVAGDILIAVISDSAGETWTGASGWTEIADRGTGVGLRIAYKVAGITEGSNYTFTPAEAPFGFHASGAILAYRRAAYDVVGSFDSGAIGANSVPPGVTLSHDGVLFAVFACSLSGQSFAAPSGMVSIVADSDATTPSFAVFAQQVGAGSTGTRSSAPSGGGRSTGILFALKGS